jgi:hypothetical protein
VPAAASCTASGVCATPGPQAGLLLVVSLPQDSFYAPGLQFVVPIEHLGDAPTAMCAWPACGHLPKFGSVTGGYLMSAHDQSATSLGGVGFYLGNQDAFGDTIAAWLPSHVTYQLVADPWNDDVVALGLPVEPLQAAQTAAAPPPYFGPYGGSGITFQASLAPGTYARTIMPDVPYDAVFGPQVRSDVVVTGGVAGAFEPVTPGEEVKVEGFDVTSEITSAVSLPSFDIQGMNGPLDGWTAFLRDQTTKQAVSNVRTLSGTLASNVQLVTNHATLDPMTGLPTDALLNTELVVAPPDGVALPTMVVQPLGKQLPMVETYPPLPAPTTVTGSVVGPHGTPVSADLVFEAFAFTDERGIPDDFPFEFVGRASARPSATAAASTFALQLPLGSYRVDVRPLDGSAAITVGEVDVVAGAAPITFTLPAQATVHGTATLSDERSLGGAIVEVIAQSCAIPAVLADAGSGGLTKASAETPWCMPRPAQTVAASDGSFAFSLDDGGYLLRVRPADGTYLPWFTTGLDVTGGSAPRVQVTVPAPFHLGFTLFDVSDKPVINAVVQAFAPPALQGQAIAARVAGQAVEIGQTLTAVDGTCDLYLALP